MGRHGNTYSDICKNVLVIGEGKFIQNYFNENNYCGDDYEYDEDYYLKYPIFKGWRFSGDASDVGKKKTLIAYEFTKDEKVIHIVNSSEYESVGDYWYVCFSDDRSAVEEFLKDFTVEIKTSRHGMNDWDLIEDVDAVQQTL